jgi:hypothetical protein
MFSNLTPANFYQTVQRPILGNRNFIFKLFSSLLSVFQLHFSNRVFPSKICRHSLYSISYITLNTRYTDFIALRGDVGYILMQYSTLITSYLSAPIIFLNTVFLAALIFFFSECKTLRSRTINVLYSGLKSAAFPIADGTIKLKEI